MTEVLCREWSECPEKERCNHASLHEARSPRWRPDGKLCSDLHVCALGSSLTRCEAPVDEDTTGYSGPISEEDESGYDYDKDPDAQNKGDIEQGINTQLPSWPAI